VSLKKTVKLLCIQVKNDVRMKQKLLNYYFGVWRNLFNMSLCESINISQNVNTPSRLKTLFDADGNNIGTKKKYI